MPDDVTPGEGLGDDDEVLDEEVLEDDDADDIDATDDDSTDPAADLNRRLSAIETQQRTLALTVNETLKREVGRIQSLAAKFDKAPTTANDEALREQVGQLGALMNEALLAIDDTALDPAVKQRISAVQQESKRKAETGDLTTQLQRMLTGMLDERLGATQEALPQNQEALDLEQEMLDEIADSELSAADFEDTWGEAKVIYGTEGARGVRRLFRQKIAQALREDGSATRRQSRKAGAAKTPKQAGAAKEDYEQLENVDVAAGFEILKRMGINV